MSKQHPPPVVGVAAPGGAFSLKSVDPLTPTWLRIVPFFMSAVFFMSGIFSLFSPLPLLLLFERSGRRWAWIAAISNALLVYALGGWNSVRLFAPLILTVALSLPEFLHSRRSLERIVIMTLAIMFAVGTGVAAAHAIEHHINPITDIRNELSKMIDYLMNSISPEMRSNWLAEVGLEEWKQGLLREIPSAVGIFSLLLVWANLVMLLRLNPSDVRARLGINTDYFKNWKAPEYLLWPTVITGFLVIFNLGWASDVGINAFKLLMAIYALQGLSILSFVFDAWKIRGLFRTVGFAVAVVLMLPLVLSLGFFDVWFDFRAKLRQS